ncbi:MAG: hypothetical protein PVJ38_07525 [Candidatus Bathyarchaeota archaeon]|jgi:hypothetical protein
MSEEKLEEFLETGGDWEKLKTTVPGVFVQKLPPYKSSPSRLAIEINPVDASGNPTKRRGLLIRYYDEYEAFKEILNDEKLPKLLDMLVEANPGSGRRKRKSDEDIIEI